MIDVASQDNKTGNADAVVKGSVYVNRVYQEGY